MRIRAYSPSWALLLPMLITFLTLSSFQVQKEKVKLRLNLQKGQVVRQWTQTEQLISQNIMGSEQNMQQTIGFGFQMEVTDIQEGTYHIDLSYYKVLFKQNSDMLGEVEYDSENPPEEIPPSALGYALMVGEGFRMQMNNMGEILAVDGTDEMVDNMIQGIAEYSADGEKPSEEQMTRVRSILEGMVSKEKMMESMQNMTGFYPEKPIRVKSQWDHQMQINTGTPMDVFTTYTVTEINGDQVVLATDGTFETSEEGATQDMGAFVMTYQLSGTQEGEVKVDRQTGLTQYSLLKQNISGQIDTDQNMSWPITIESTVTITQE